MRQKATEYSETKLRGPPRAYGIRKRWIAIPSRSSNCSKSRLAPFGEITTTSNPASRSDRHSDQTRVSVGTEAFSTRRSTLRGPESGCATFGPATEDDRRCALALSTTRRTRAPAETNPLSGRRVLGPASPHSAPARSRMRLSESTASETAFSCGSRQTRADRILATTSTNEEQGHQSAISPLCRKTVCTA